MFVQFSVHVCLADLCALTIVDAYLENRIKGIKRVYCSQRSWGNVSLQVEQFALAPLLFDRKNSRLTRLPAGEEERCYTPAGSVAMDTVNAASWRHVH